MSILEHSVTGAHFCANPNNCTGANYCAALIELCLSSLLTIIVIVDYIPNKRASQFVQTWNVTNLIHSLWLESVDGENDLTSFMLV